jgi:Na+/melibiose symporter-like transporter
VGSVFLINVPIIVVALIAGAVLVPTSKDPDQQPLDLPGAGLSIIGLGALVYAIIEGPHFGWTSGRTLGTFVLALVTLGLFGLRELTARHPMLDLRLFRDRRFSVASAGMTLTFFAMFGTFFLVAQYFQLVLGYSPLESGLFQLPMAFVIMSVAPQAPKLVARFGAARVVPVGLGLTATGLAAFSQVGVDTVIWSVYIAIVPLAAGMALTMTPLTTLIMSSVPLGRAGVGSAMNDTTRELGGALGVAVLGSVVTSQYTASLAPSIAGLPGEARAAADSGLTGALAVAERIGGTTGAEITAAAQAAFVDGMGLAAVVGSLVVFTAAAVAWFLLPKGTEVPPGAVPADVDRGPVTAGVAVGATDDVVLAPIPDGAAGELVDEGTPTPSPIVD